MATATFLSWSDFKSHTSVTLPRYFVLRGDGFLGIAMGVVVATGVQHLYIPPNEEEILTEGLGSDLWFVGAVKVASVT